MSTRGISPLEPDIEITDFLPQVTHKLNLRLQSALLEKHLALQLIILLSVAINSSVGVSLNLLLVLPKLSDLALELDDEIMIKGELSCAQLLHLRQSEVQAFNLLKILGVNIGQAMPEVSHLDLI